jgi:hypothetical protein
MHVMCSIKQASKQREEEEEDDDVSKAPRLLLSLGTKSCLRLSTHLGFKFGFELLRAGPVNYLNFRS